MAKKGKFIVLEGIDGSGKTVQFGRLIKRLKEKKIDFKKIDFPRYGKPSSYFVEQYLNGSYGGWKDVSAYRASLFYALDRFAASSQLKDWLKKGKVVISNRYVGSNLGHQGVKIHNKTGRKQFYQWVNNLEYGILGLPKPDLNIFLHVPAEICFDLVEKKGKREYLGKKTRDIHEQDIKHLKQAEKIFCEVRKLYHKDFFKIECVKGKKLLSRQEISDKIWKAVEKVLK